MEEISQIKTPSKRKIQCNSFWNNNGKNTSFTYMYLEKFIILIEIIQFLKQIAVHQSCN